MKKGIVAIIFVVIILAAIFYFLLRNTDDLKKDPAKDESSDKGIYDQSFETVEPTAPATTVQITNTAIREFVFSMVAGDKKITGKSTWNSDPPNLKIQQYQEHWAYIFKNQVLGDYRFVILQWLAGYNPDTGAYTQGVAAQTNFYIIPTNYGFNVDMAVDKGYIDWNTNQYIELI